MTITKDVAIKTLRDASQKLLDEYLTTINSAYCQVPEAEDITANVVAALAATSHIAPDAAAIQAEGADLMAVAEACAAQGCTIAMEDWIESRSSRAIAPEASELPPIKTIDHDAFWVLFAHCQDARPGADYRKKSENLVAYVNKWAIAMHQAAAEPVPTPAAPVAEVFTIPHVSPRGERFYLASDIDDPVAEVFTIRHVSTRGDKFCLVSDIAAPVVAEGLTPDQTRRIYAEWQHAGETPHGLFKRFQAAAAHPVASETPAHMTGKQIFDLAAPYFIWNAKSWQEATQGTINMSNLLSFTRALLDTTTPIAASEAVSDWTVGSLLTMSDCDYPGMGSVFGQIWQGDDLIARVYGGSAEEVRERTARIAAPAAPTDVKLALQKLCDQLDGMKRTMFNRPGTGQDYSYLVHEDVQAYVEAARTALAGSVSDARFNSVWNDALEEAALTCDQQAAEPECPESAEYCADAIRALAASQAAPAKAEGWISCDERVPEVGIPVLALMSWGDMVIEEWVDYSVSACDMNPDFPGKGFGWCENSIDDITHWTPLPSTPAKEPTV